MRILGIDPGTARVGWGIVDEQAGKLTTLRYGCITTNKSNSPPDRLSIIYNEVKTLLITCKPNCVSVEEIFFAANAKTAISVGQARGVILLAAAHQNIPVVAYSPLAVKKAICGSGTADKKQVGQMIIKLLKLKDIPKPDDTADALAIAATHAYSYRLKQVLTKHPNITNDKRVGREVDKARHGESFRAPRLRRV